MLYQVRLQYGFLIEADNRDQAFRLARKRLLDSPDSAISKVEQYGTPKGKAGVVKRLITGR